MSPPIGKGAISVASVRPSVRLSVCPFVAYMANNSTTQRSSVPKFGTKVSHFRCDSHTSFKVKRSKVRVTRPINADTHRAPYLPNGNCLRTLNLVYGWRTTTHINHRCHDLQGQKSRSHGHVITLSRVGPNLYTCVIRGRREAKIRKKYGTNYNTNNK